MEASKINQPGAGLGWKSGGDYHGHRRGLGGGVLCKAAGTS